jgi:hypothetical protein
MTWANPPEGVHQLEAVATDANNLTVSAFLTVQVLSNLPPVIDITSPADDTVFMPGDPKAVSLTASDPTGTVRQVELHLRDHRKFSISGALGPSVGTNTVPPFDFQLTAPAVPGHYVLTALGTDNQGLAGQSQPVHLMIVAPPVLTVSLSQLSVVVNWTPPQATLLQAQFVTGPWQVVSNAIPPLRLVPQANAVFFRARLP